MRHKGARYQVPNSNLRCSHSSASILMLKSGPEMPYPQDHLCATRGRGIKYPIATFLAVTARLLSRCEKVVRQICQGLVFFVSWALGYCVPALVEWSLESSTGQCYGLCAPNPSTMARVRNSAAPSYECFCPYGNLS